jgi:NAD(P)-dependent dehydrogenase (short-subunit alcohol dehydrogenase family)
MQSAPLEVYQQCQTSGRPIISGSGRGIDRAVALKLAHEGARVVVNDLDVDPAQAVVEEIKDFGAEAVACSGDVSIRLRRPLREDRARYLWWH